MSDAKRVWRGWVVAPALACAVMVGCGDDEKGDEPDGSAPAQSDAGPADAATGFVPVRDGGMDASIALDASLSDGSAAMPDAGDAAVPLPPQLPAAVAKLAGLSPDQSDRFSAVTFGADGKIYAAGYLRTVVGDVTDQKLAVARFGTDGNLDLSFGELANGGPARTGIATVNLNVATAAEKDELEAARGLAVQSDGKIVIVGNVPRGKIMLTAEQPVLDLAVARLDATGALDATYAAADADGIAGAAIFSLGATVEIAPTGTQTAPTIINDSADGLALDSMGRALVFASGKSEAERSDRDRFVVRLTTDGALDSAFAGDGKSSHDLSGMMLNDNAKPGLVLAGDKVLSPGYTSVGGKNHIGLLRLNADGTEDGTFDGDGKVFINPLAPNGFAEAYGAALQSTGHYVTVGYGNEGTPPNKVVSFRFSAAGAKDDSYGVAGAVLLDVQADADQGRAIVALPDDRLLVVGNSNPAMGASDALVALLTKDGQLDRSFNATGTKAYDFGRASEQLASVAVSRDGKYAAAVGWSFNTNGPDDATLWIQKLAD